MYGRVCCMELTEKQKNCKYCHYDADGRPLKYLKNNDDCSIFLTDDELLHIRALKGYTTPSMLLIVNYCPKCGRSLNEKSVIRERKCFECNGTVTNNSEDTLLSLFFDDREKNNFILQRHDDYDFSYNLLFDFCPFCRRLLSTPVPRPYD